MVKIIKDWILLIAIITGILTYQWVWRLSFLVPYLLFVMLLLTFSNISWKDIRFHPAHIWLLLIQLIGSIVVYLLIRPFNEMLAQGALICVLAPTANAAPAITGMLGGSVGFLTAYMLFCNLAVAIAAPIYFSFMHLHGELSFLDSAWYIGKRVFPLLVLPLFLAAALRTWVPKVNQTLVRISQFTLYFWVVVVIIVMGSAVRLVVDREISDYSTKIGLAVIALILCCFQFIVGRRIGYRYGDPVSSGQGLGQKNTSLAIWMAQAFLIPLVCIAPATYIIWQGIINSFQLWRKNRG